MLPEVSRPTTHLLEGISQGQGNVELDRGGFWSKDYHIWVDKRFAAFINKPLFSPEAEYIETLGDLGLSAGKLYDRQLEDAKNGVMWPKELLEEGGAEIFLAAAKKNPSILEPYSLISEGLESPSIPYSQAYYKELMAVRQNLLKAMIINSPSAKDLQKYLYKLEKAFSYDKDRVSDISLMEAADLAWIKIPSDISVLPIAEWTEDYHDPLRIAISQDSGINKLARKVTKKNGIGFWKPFFEFRLMAKDELAAVSEDKIKEIRNTSRKLFATSDNKEVPVSLEFRRLLLASGQGAHPAKSAKNFPNFEQIRDNYGYKNILFANMIEEGTLNEVIPAIKEAFGDNTATQYDEQQWVRGSSLRIVAHEENHPFRRFRGDGSLEELKATVNGLQALIKSEQFNENDINSALLSEIGGALTGKQKLDRAVRRGDNDTEASLEAYYKADTIFLNFLKQHNCFVFRDGKAVGIDLEKTKKSINIFVDYLGKANAGKEVKNGDVYDNYYKTEVWNDFRIVPLEV